VEHVGAAHRGPAAARPASEAGGPHSPGADASEADGGGEAPLIEMRPLVPGALQDDGMGAKPGGALDAPRPAAAPAAGGGGGGAAAGAGVVM
jgi:hypothetical protein